MKMKHRQTEQLLQERFLNIWNVSKANAERSITADVNIKKLMQTKHPPSSIEQAVFLYPFGGEIMELKDTVQLMQSDNYKDRFRAEYQQLVIRFEKLKKMVDNWDNLSFVPICPKSTYNMQLKAMSEYIAVLEARAAIEQIAVWR